MIQINLVARIAGDKNSFLDLVYIAYKLKQNNINDFNILFIGDILNISIYQNIVRMADLLDVSANISFTKRSIPFSDLAPAIKDGYFINLTVGSFTGYSGIESLSMGFKTIFYNADKRHENEVTEYINVCSDIPSVINLIKLINKDKLSVNKQMISNNSKMKSYYSLNDKETSLLLSFMSPKI